MADGSYIPAREDAAIVALTIETGSSNLRAFLEEYRTADVTGRRALTDDQLYDAEDACDELTRLAEELADECRQAIRYVRRLY